MNYLCIFVTHTIITFNFFVHIVTNCFVGIFNHTANLLVKLSYNKVTSYNKYNFIIIIVNLNLRFVQQNSSMK